MEITSNILNELNETLLTDNFQFISIIGKGSFGTVISAFSKKESKVVAIKIIKRVSDNKKSMNDIENEAQILQQINHPNIIHFYQLHYTKLFIFLIVEFVNGQTLDQIIKERQYSRSEPIFDENEILLVIRQLLKALNYIHRRGVIHRDLKPANIMIIKNHETLQLKLIDFGLSFKGENFTLSSKQCGTPIFIAPEIFQHKDYNQSVDIFAVGIIQFLLFSGGVHPIWKNGMTMENYQYLFEQNNFQIQFPEQMKQKEMAIHFFKKTFAVEPQDRMTVYQCLDHPWIRGTENIVYPITINETVQVFKTTQLLENMIKAIYFINNLKLLNPKEIPKEKTKSYQIIIHDSNHLKHSTAELSTVIHQKNSSNILTKLSTLPNDLSKSDCSSRSSQRSSKPQQKYKLVSRNNCKFLSDVTYTPAIQPRKLFVNAEVDFNQVQKTRINSQEHLQYEKKNQERRSLQTDKSEFRQNILSEHFLPKIKLNFESKPPINHNKNLQFQVQSAQSYASPKNNNQAKFYHV